MKGSAAITYAVRSVLRNPRPTGSALVGLVLGIAVVTAPWVSLDSSLRGLVRYYEEGLTMDAMAGGPLGNLDPAADDVRAVRNVAWVEALGIGYVLVNATRSNLPVDYGLPLEFHFVHPTFGTVASRQGIEWAGPPAPGTVVLPKPFEDGGLRIGDPLVVEHRTPIYDTNGTIVGEEVTTTSVLVGGFFRSVFPLMAAFPNFAFLDFSDFAAIRSGLNLSGSEVFGVLEIWFDREALLNPFDLGNSRARIERELLLVQNALFPYGFALNLIPSARGPTLAGIPETVEGATFPLRVLFLVFAIPAFAIAALLARVGFDIGVSTRRRELAVLRARGASLRGMRGHLLVEASLLGLMASLLGLGLGLLLSRFFHAEILVGPPGALPTSDPAITLGTIGLALFLGWALSVGASYAPARLAASEDLVGALKSFHPAEAWIDHRASRDFLLSAIAAAGFLLLLAWGSVRDSPLGPLTFVLGLSVVFVTPVAPFLVTVAVARYLTRGTSRPYRFLARLFRRSLGDLHVLVDRNLDRSPRRSSNTAMIVTFVVGFVVAISTLVASADAYREQQIRWAVPSDLVVEAGGIPILGVFNASNYAGVQAIPGVAAAVRVVDTSSTRGTVFLFDADAYLTVVPWLTAGDLNGMDPDALIAVLARGDSFAANQRFQRVYGLEPGDPLRFGEVQGMNVTLRLHAYVPRLPGLHVPLGTSMDTEAYLSFAAVPDANLTEAWNGRYLVRLRSGANETAVIDSIRDFLGPAVSITSQQEQRRFEAANPLTITVFGYLQAQSYMSILILVVAVALLVTSAAAERQDEFATMMARGLDARRAWRLLAVEGWVVCILGLVVGVFGGLITAWTFLWLAATVSSTMVPFVVPWTVVIPLLAILGGTWVAGLLGAWFIQRMDVSRLLKLRSG